MDNETLHEGIPEDENEALRWLVPLLDLDSCALKRIIKDDFFRGWASILFLYSGLHPDEALERGEISCEIEDIPGISCLEPRLLKPFFKTSGWPLVLVPIAEEAWRRFRSGNLQDEELYCSDAQMAGMHFRISV